jgi:nitrogen regulatory protein PII
MAMYMILFVLDNPQFLDEVLDAWDEIGVSGVTIIDSTGINRRRQALQVGTPFMAGINRILSGDLETHNTLFTIVQNETIVHECIVAAEKIVGDLNQPNSGVLAAWEIPIVKGIPSMKENLEDV